MLLLGAHSLSPQEDPKQGHFRLRGKENRDSSHNPWPLGNSSGTVQQQQQGKAHQGRSRSRRPGIAGGLRRWSGPCPARPGTGTEPQTHLRPPGHFPADPGDRRNDHLLFSKPPGPTQEQDRHPRGAFPSKRRPCGRCLVRGRGQRGPGRQDKQWGWAERVEGVIHLLIHENRNNAEQGPHSHAGQDLCPLL